MAAVQPAQPVPAGTSTRRQAGAARFLRVAAVIFAIGLLVHGADHVRRGLSASPLLVVIAGNVQLAAAVLVVAMVFMRHRWAARGAVILGFASAIGFAAAHLLPAWGPLSDSFVHAPASAGVTAYSWVTAIVEICTDAVFGIAGIRAFRSNERSS